MLALDERLLDGLLQEADREVLEEVDDDEFAAYRQAVLDALEELDTARREYREDLDPFCPDDD